MENKNISIISKKIDEDLTHVLYKYKNRIFCFISVFYNKTKNEMSYTLLLGKPSDASCMGADYDTFEEADKRAKEFLDDYIDCITSI